MSLPSAKYVDGLTEKFNNSTDCSVLITLIRENSRVIEDAIESVQTEIENLAKNYLPLIKPPRGRPSKIIKWVKKLISGTIMPQVRAYTLLAIELAELAQSAAKLAQAINKSKDRLKHCADDVLLQTIEQEIAGLRNDLEAPLTNALNEIDQAQMQLESAFGKPLDATFNTGNSGDDIFERAEAFSSDALVVLNIIENQAADVIQDETNPPLEGLGADEVGEEVDSIQFDVKYEDGIAVAKIPRNRGFNGTIDVITSVTSQIANPDDPIMAQYTENVFNWSTLTFTNGILTGKTDNNVNT